MIKFITGRSGQGKSVYILNKVKENINKKEKSMIIVPDQGYFNFESNALNFLGENMQQYVEILSFNDLATLIFSKLSIVKNNIIDEIGITMIIYKVLEENKNNFRFFGSKLKERGFISSLLKLITEMKSYNVETENLDEVFKSIDDELLKDKIHDVNLIFKKCRELSNDRYMDSQDELQLLYEKLEEYKEIKEYHVFIDEFSSFAPKQYKVIERLAKLCKNLSIALTYDEEKRSVKETDTFFVTSKVIDKIIDIARNNNIPVEFKDTKSESTRFKNDELRHLERNFYAYPPKLYKGSTKDIKIKMASNDFEEAIAIAKEILKNIRDENFRFKDIAVVTRELDQYKGIIKAVFNEYNIPLFLDQKKDIKSNKIIVFIKSALEIIFRNWNKDSVLKYLKTYLLDISKEDIDILENYILANGIKGKKKWFEESWDYPLPFKSMDEKLELERINSIKKKIVEPFDKMYKLTISNSKGEKISKILYEFIEDSKVIKTVEKLVDTYRENGEQEFANEYSQIWNIIILTIEQMVETLGDNDLSLEEYTKILSIGFAENSMGLIPPAIDQVLVGEISRTVIKDIKILYIIGVNDGSFPKVITDEGLLSDNDRGALEKINIKLASSTKLKVFEEQFLVYETLTASSEKLILSYPIADKEGRAKAPSMIISRVKSIFENIIEESALDKTSYIEDITLPIPTFNQLIGVMRDRIRGEEGSAIWNDAYKWFNENEEFYHKKDNLLKGLYYTNQKEPIEKEKAKLLYGYKSSVSRLESYSKCPFNYFINYGLRVEERKVYGFNAMDKGSLFHNVIDRFSRKVFTDGTDIRNIKEEFYDNFIKDTLKEIENENNSVLRSSNKYKYMTKRFQLILNRTLKTIISQVAKGDFQPVSFEAEFDEKGEYKPIEIKISEEETINLKGKIDRIDIIEFEDKIFVRIIDYKSGSKTIDLNEVYSGLTLQLLVYLDVILNSMEKENKKLVMPAAVLYYKIDNPILKKDNKLYAKDIDKIIEENLKFKGYILRDKEVVTLMDRDIEENKKSTVLPVTLKKDGEFSAGKSLLEEEDFNTIRLFVREKIKEISKEMFNGNIKVEPKRSVNITSCTYCNLSEVCGFDTLMEDNQYVEIINLSDKEIIEIMKNKCSINEEKGR